MTVHYNWKHLARTRLEEGGELHGNSFRKEAGGKVNIRGFVESLELNEGWEFDKTTRSDDGFPTIYYRLIAKKGVPFEPSARPTDTIVRRLLSGEELDFDAVAEELPLGWAMLVDVKMKLEEAGFEYVEREDGDHMMVSIRRIEQPAAPPPKPKAAKKPRTHRPKPPPKPKPPTPEPEHVTTAVIVKEAPPRKKLKFGAFEI